MTLTFHINLDSIFYLPDWVVHPTLVDPFLFPTAGAEQVGRAKGWSPAQALWAGFFKQRDFFERSEIEIRCPRCEAPLPTNHNNDKKYINNAYNNDLYNVKPPKSDNDNLTDGTEDANHNGRIDGDNGDGTLSDMELWQETSPNIADSDADEITDFWEIQYGYSPVKADTDGDSLLDSEEDLDMDGELESGETNPLKIDSDDDGLDDNMEKAGWTVVIIYESTKELKIKYTVMSNPLVKDSDGDGLSDFEEYSNITDPWVSDTDGDGKTDIQEITGDYNSSATGIDGEPPEIWHFNFYYEENYQDFFFLKIPTGGLKVIAEIGAKDIFGIDTIYADITGLKDKKIHCGGQENVTYTLEWSINSVDKYERVLFKGFSINISIIDVNGNLGFKLDDLPSVKDMAIAFFLGPLLTIVEMISELVSEFLSWIDEAIKNVISPPLEKFLNLFSSFLEFIFQSLSDAYNSVIENSDIISSEINEFINFIFYGPIIVTLMIIGVAISVALLVCCGIDSLISYGIQLLIIIITIILMSSSSSGELPFGVGLILNPLTDFSNSYEEENSKPGTDIGADNNDALEGFYTVCQIIFAVYACYKAAIALGASEIAGYTIAGSSTVMPIVALVLASLSLQLLQYSISPIFASPLITIINPYSNLHSLLVLIRKQNLTKGPIT